MLHNRLIGPKGRHMSDIVAEAKGAKVWIIGRRLDHIYTVYIYIYTV